MQDRIFDRNENSSDQEALTRLEAALLLVLEELENNRQKIGGIIQECLQLEYRLKLRREKIKQRPEELICPDPQDQTGALGDGSILEETITRNDELIQKAGFFLQRAYRVLKCLQASDVWGIESGEKGPFLSAELSMWLAERQEAEKRKIVRDLHDGPTQILFTLLIRLELMKDNPEAAFGRMAEEIALIQDMGKECLAELKHIMLDLKPPLFYEAGLIPTFQEYFRIYEGKYHFHIDFDYTGEKQPLSPQVEAALFRLMQEGLNNARKHSGTNQARVRVGFSPVMVGLEISDRGRGFDSHQVLMYRDDRLGIKGMIERAELMGGNLHIASAAGTGTRLEIRLPIKGGGHHGED